MTYEEGARTRPSSPHPRRNAVLRLIVLLLVAYAAGFAVFVVKVPPPRASDDANADAIVALTGEGDRLTPAVQLLEMGNGARLLITGVNKANSKSQLKALLKGGSSFDCCADLGFTAADTRGNAQEAAKWARDHHYKSLIVVTAAYHMPRSLLEFRSAMPDVALVPYPVAGDMPGEMSWQSLKRLNGEYAKYLASWLRAAVARTHDA